MKTEGLEGFADHFEAMLEDLRPGKRKMVARKIGQRLRRLNTARIAANVQPDGSAMEPRKPRRDRRGRIRRAVSKKMFRRLRYARNLKITANPNRVELAFKSGADIAEIHHFGKIGTVGKDNRGQAIRTRYPVRHLLGFGAQDEAEIEEELLSWIDRD